MQDNENGTRWPVRCAAGALAVAVAAAGWFGWTWWHDTHDDGVRRAITRDQALSAGRTEIATFTTLDHRTVDAGFARWLADSTGELHDDLVANQARGKQSVTDARTVTTGRVLDAAVTDLDPDGGTAKVIATVSTVVTPDGGAPTEKRNRFQAELTRTDTGWRLSSLGQVPVGTS